MECNKEEALRAKDIAEKKMQMNDYIGAKKIALKAQRLYPDLENISKILTVCEVQCSAQNKLYGSEMDWYGILGIDKLADETTIKKQYRKLALLLHPDKNKFCGAESAFKFIGEANRMLSDKGKRSLYDMKCRVPVRTFATPKCPSYQNVSTPKFTGLKSRSVINNGRATFWTGCPFCNTRYQFYREISSKTLSCQSCKKTFVAHDIGPQGVPNLKQQPVSTQPKSMYKPNSPQKVPQNTSRQGPQLTKVICGLFAQKTVGKNLGKKAKSSAKGVGDLGNAKENVERKSPRNKNKKRDRKFQSDVDDEGMGMKENGCSSNGHLKEDDDGFRNPLKTAKMSDGSTSVLRDDGKSFSPPGKNLPNGKFEVDDSDVKSEKKENSEENPNTESNIYDYPDPDFSNFDKNKAENCFHVDQVWAVYDAIDAMPRFYALIRKIHPSNFKLRIVWLEPNPNDSASIDWTQSGLPVSCGHFKHGSTHVIDDRLMFSHVVRFEKGSSRGSYVIYPRKGETWALFKDWDMKWSSNPENHKLFKYEIVEILSDFDRKDGIRVSFLSKVEGFVSVFQRKKRNGASSVLISANEMFEFSHQIPSCRMSGVEREGVPEGSLELDPVSLPNDLNEFYDHTT